MTELLSPRINSALLPEYIGRKVRLTCKVLKNEIVLLQTSDGGQVEGKIIPPKVDMDVFVEVLCTVESSMSVSIIRVKRLGDKISLEVVDKAISLANDARFKDYFQP